MRTDTAKSRARKARRVEKAAENAALAALGGIPLLYDVTLPDGTELKATRIAPKRFRTAPGRKQKRKRAPSRKSLVRKADTAFSLHIRALYPVSFFSGKPTECCFHIITRSKHSIRWALDNAVGSTMGENYEMEFNPHKFISILIQKRGLPWYENLVRHSNVIRKHGRGDLERIAEVGYDENSYEFDKMRSA
jgi:hypothetical protein